MSNYDELMKMNKVLDTADNIDKLRTENRQLKEENEHLRRLCMKASEAIQIVRRFQNLELETKWMVDLAQIELRDKKEVSDDV